MEQRSDAQCICFRSRQEVHAPMTTWRLLTSTWVWDPSVLLGCAALLCGYVAALRPLTTRAILFGGAVVVLLLALVSPLDTLGDHYLFSAHMLQHLLLVLAVPPLLLLGLPPAAFERALRWGAASRAERALGHPLLAWLVGIGTLWAWHAPSLYEAALRNPGVHVFQHLCFLVSATIFWWPVIAPVPERQRLSSLAAVAYLIAGGLVTSLLGIILTFAAPGLYPSYLHPLDPRGILPLLRQGWGLTPQSDQQLGGLLMWVLSAPVYLVATAITLARWYREPEADELAGVSLPHAPVH